MDMPALGLLPLHLLRFVLACRDARGCEGPACAVFERPSGSVVIDGRVLRAGDFHHADEDSHHGEITTTEGAEVLVVGAIEDYLPAA